MCLCSCLRALQQEASLAGSPLTQTSMALSKATPCLYELAAMVQTIDTFKLLLLKINMLSHRLGATTERAAKSILPTATPKGFRAVGALLSQHIRTQPLEQDQQGWQLDRGTGIHSPGKSSSRPYHASGCSPGVTLRGEMV